VEQQREIRRWRAYLSDPSSVFPATAAQKEFEEVARVKTDLLPTKIIDMMKHYLHKRWLGGIMPELQIAATIPTLDRRFFDLCRNFAGAESVTGSEMADFWTIVIEDNERFKKLISSQFDDRESGWCLTGIDGI
jgi:hypothetical protein